MPSVAPALAERHRVPNHVMPVRHDVHRSRRATLRTDETPAHTRPRAIRGKPVEPEVYDVLAVAIEARDMTGCDPFGRAPGWIKVSLFHTATILVLGGLRWWLPCHRARRAIFLVVGLKLVTHHPVIEPVSEIRVRNGIFRCRDGGSNPPFCLAETEAETGANSKKPAIRGTNARITRGVRYQSISGDPLGGLWGRWSSRLSSPHGSHPELASPLVAVRSVGAENITPVHSHRPNSCPAFRPASYKPETAKAQR
jgi:hypothetical protein